MKKKTTGTPDAAPQKTEMENLQEDILYLLKESVELAKENPNSNTLYAVLRGLSAAKLSFELTQKTKRTGKKEKMISREMIEFIEKEILGIK